MGTACKLGHFTADADRNAATADRGYGLETAINATRARLHRVASDLIPGQVFAPTPRTAQQVPDPPQNHKTYAQSAGAGRGRRGEGHHGKRA